MKLFDSHCHINDEAFSDDLPDVLGRMHENGIKKAVVVGDVKDDCEPTLELLKENDFLYGAFGLHPENADAWEESFADKLAELMSKDKVVALGEIGLDYHYDTCPRERQKEVFVRQLKLAYELDKPVVLHIREAHGDAYEILTGCVKHGYMPRGIMHCYGGSLESAAEYIRMGLYISFSGSLTFKNAPNLTRCAENLPLDRLLVETDCPYMSPVPYRGRRNEPSYVRYTCEKLAQIRGISLEEAADATYENALRVFGIDNRKGC